MAMELMVGRAYHYDGTVHPFSAGLSDRIQANRLMGVTTHDIQEDNVDFDSWLAHVAYFALKRQGDLTEPFETWSTSTVANIEVGEDPESPAPLA